MRTERKIFFRPLLLVSPLYAGPMRKCSLATSEKREWKSGLKVLDALRPTKMAQVFCASNAVCSKTMTLQTEGENQVLVGAIPFSGEYPGPRFEDKFRSANRMDGISKAAGDKMAAS